MRQTCGTFMNSVDTYLPHCTRMRRMLNFICTVFSVHGVVTIFVRHNFLRAAHFCRRHISTCGPFLRVAHFCVRHFWCVECWCGNLCVKFIYIYSIRDSKKFYASNLCNKIFKWLGQEGHKTFEKQVLREVQKWL
jgi:hypothetical protein